MEYPFDQSARRRGWNDTKVAWKSLPFIILDAVGCVVVGAIFVWWWGVILFVFAMICVLIGATATAPFKQRNEARKRLSSLQTTLGQVGFIEACMNEATEYRNELKRLEAELIQEPDLFDDDKRNTFRKWYKDVADYLRREIPQEYPQWYHDVDIQTQNFDFQEAINAYNAGYTLLRDIQKGLISQSMSHKEGSQI